MSGIDYVPSPTGVAFLASQKFVKTAMGPVGGGKSTMALMDIVQRSFMQEPYDDVRYTKHLIVRNTLQQLKSTVKPIIDTWLVAMPRGTMGDWQLTDHTFMLRCRLPDGSVVSSDFLMMPADTPEDVRRLLSLEVSDAWIEEGREVVEEIVEGITGRVGRFPSMAMGGCTYPGVVVSTNPPPLGGFWHGKITNPPANWEIFTQPPAILSDGAPNPEADNLANLPANYYPNLMEGKSQEWIDVYLRNEFGEGNSGKAVYRGTYRKEFHVAANRLLAVPQSVNKLIIGVDNGLTAAAAILQRDMRGRVNLLGECAVPEGLTMGFETFMDKMLIPKLVSEFAMFRRENIVFVGDPAIAQRSQVDEKTIEQAIRLRGYTVFLAPTNDPERRTQAVETLLNLQIDAGPGFLIDPTCTETINSFSWAYRYRKAPDGIITTAIEKNHASHLGDAIQYGCLFYTGITAPGARFSLHPPARPVRPAPRHFVYS
jgi:hypothetical protein